MSNGEGSTFTPESSQARMTLVEALRYHASLMIAPEVAPKVRALLNDASTVMWAAAEALSTESESVQTFAVPRKYLDLADLIVRDVCEIPDRTSPDDQPEMMLVTPNELRDIIRNRLENAKSAWWKEHVGEAGSTPPSAGVACKPVAWVNGEELKTLANPVIATYDTETRPSCYDTPLYLAPPSATAPLEDKPVAWLIERPKGTGKQQTIEHEVVLSPLTDDTFMDEGDQAWPLYRRRSVGPTATNDGGG